MDEIRRILHCDSAPVNGSGVRVAVLDTGVDVEHPDFRRCLARSESTVTCMTFSGELADVHGHGTHVAGIIAGSGEASGGRYRGVAPGVELVVIKVSDRGSGFGGDVAAGVLHALEVGVDIINYSGGQAAIGRGPWKWPQKLSKRDEAFRYASDRGVLCVAAAGNEGPDPGTVIRPGALPEVLCVGATAPPTYHVAARSARGPVYIDSTLPKNQVARADPDYDQLITVRKPDVVAPGGSALTPHEYDSEPLIGDAIIPFGPVSARSRRGKFLGIDPGDPACLYMRMSGTSQATAVVTGLAALLLDAGRRAGADLGDNQGLALREILKDAARPLTVGTHDDYGHGALIWPNIVATLDDFIREPVCRERILKGPQLRLTTD